MIRTENIHINSINRRSFLSSISVTEMIFLINILLWITRAKKNMMELLILAGSTIFLLLVIFLFCWGYLLAYMIVLFSE